MKNAILSAALVLTFAAPAAFAQAMPSQDPAQQNQVQQNPAQQDGSQHRMPDPHRAAMRIGRQLNLTPDQTARLEPILADRQQKVQALRANTSLTDDQRRAQMRTILQGTRLQMANILSPDQMKQLKELRRHGGQQEGADAPQGV